MSATTFSHFFGVVVGGMSATTFSHFFVCCGWWDVSHPFPSGVFCVVVGGMSATTFSQEFYVLWMIGCQPPLFNHFFYLIQVYYL